MAKKSKVSDYEYDIFAFGNDENGNYVNLIEEERKKREEKFKEYPFEEIIKGNEFDNNYMVVAQFHTGCLYQWGHTLEEIRKEIEMVAKTKCYHCGNMEKNIYAYSFKEDDDFYWFCIENDNHIVVIRHTDNINSLLTGEKKICYPACCMYIFEKHENEPISLITSGYGKYKEDIRYKVLCDEFKILEFSTNRIYPNKKSKDFYECEFKLSDFIKYHGEA